MLISFSNKYSILKKTLLYLIVLLHFAVFSQEKISFISWNIRDFGRTKSSEELDRMAEIVRDVDIFAMQ